MCAIPISSPPLKGHVAAAFLIQTIHKDERTIKLEIWDTAGQEKFHGLAPLYYQSVLPSPRPLLVSSRRIVWSLNDALSSRAARYGARRKWWRS
jgi:hypothetical protein